MSTAIQRQKGVSAATVLALVEALYAYAEEPAHWNDITAAVEALPEPLDPGRDPAARTILTHAARAAAMLDRLNAGRSEQQAGVGDWDAALLSSEGLVRGVAGGIRARLQPFLVQALELGKRPSFDGQSERTFATAMANALSPDAALIPFKLGTVRGPSRFFGVVLPRAAFPPSLAAKFGLGHVWTEPLFAVVYLSERQGKDGGRAFSVDIGLTSAESKLAAKLLQGFAINDAARDLGMQESTARWHIKNIYEKTGAQRQPELLMLLREASDFPKGSGHTEPVKLPPGTPARRFVTLADGRRLFYREYGVAHGAPVVYFHFGLCASMLPPAAASAVANVPVRVISFERPGFGQSDQRSDYTFETIAEDVEELCRALKLTSVSLFGDGYGGGFAVAAARTLSIPVGKLALHAPNLGRDPNQASGSTSAFARQLWLVPLAAEILRKGLRIGVVRSLMSYVAEKSRVDAALIRDRRFDDYLNAAVFDALEKTSAGLAAETIMFGKGARTDATGIKCPIAVWHGAENSIVPLSSSEAEFANHPNAEMKVFPHTGLFLGEAEFREIFSWLAGSPKEALSQDLRPGRNHV